MVLHPAGLEGGVLPVVAEHQQPRPLGVVHHVLREHVHVGDIGGAHRAGRLAVVAADAAGPLAPQERQLGQHARVVLLLPQA